MIESTKLPLRGFMQKLVMDDMLTEELAFDAINKAAEAKVSLVKYLVSNQILKSSTIAESMTGFFGIPLLDLSAYDNSLIPQRLISDQLVQQHMLLPLLKKEAKLYVATADPSNLSAINEIKFHTGLKILTVIVEQDKLEKLIESTLNAANSSVLGDLSGVGLDDLEIASENENLELDDKTSEVDDAPIVKYVNKIILDAIHKGASDIHYEPFEKNYRIRFRKDGILYEYASIPSNLGIRITARLKIMSQLDISERRIPQDGRFKMVISLKRSVDFRVNTCPTVHGEKVVMRILDASKSALNVDLLGLDERQKALFLNSIHKPQGLILVTGPTGSGKTITLYTALSILNTMTVNISTVEDPVEIHLQGISQVNINLKTGLTFAAALRAFLRQDPDIIMVGEMRDLETAEIGVKAAQTGHLVLSTLHTNSAPETITRLLNMGIPAYNIATSLNLIIAQRLVRKLCPNCKVEEKLPKEVLLELGFSELDLANLIIYTGRGCDACHEGYTGRVGIYEMLHMTDEIAQIIISGGGSLDIIKAAKKSGMLTLRESGLIKVKEGITSLSELNRVTKD